MAGYTVYLVSDGVRLVYDLLCRPEREAIDALLAELILDARDGRAAAIDLGYVGPPNLLTRRLRAFGFLRRRAQNGLRVYLDGDSPHGVDLRRRESWYYMTGDTDF